MSRRPDTSSEPGLLDYRIAVEGVMLAHLRDLERRVEQLTGALGIVRERNAQLRARVCKLERARDRWKQKAITRGQRAHRQRERAELWKYRTLSASTSTPPSPQASIDRQTWSA